MCCFRGKALQIILSNNLSICLQFLHENSLEVVYSISSWNRIFLTWRGRCLLIGGILPFSSKVSETKYTSAEWPPSSVMTSLSFSPSLSSSSYMELMHHVFNLTDSAVNKWYNIGDVWTSVWLKSKTELLFGFLESLLQLNVRSWNPMSWQQLYTCDCLPVL